jgi:PAS domain S-box-containing protein
MTANNDPSEPSDQLHELRRENEELRARVRELGQALEEPLATVQAIRDGLVDAVVVDRSEVPEVLTLESADEMYLRLAQQAAKVGTWEWDVATGRLNASPTFWQLLGEASPPSQADLGLWERRIAADDREQFTAKLNNLRERGDEFSWEHRVTGMDGETRWLDTRGCLLCSVNGDDRRVVGVSLDITPRMRAEEKLRLADRHKTEFLATLAHELRNPLAPIQNSLNILHAANDATPSAYRLYEMMERQVGNLVRLVDDLLEMSRISTGKIELRRDIVDLTAVIRSAVETSRPLIDAAGHELNLSLPPEPLAVDVDPMRISQVLANLLNNAAKYTKPGGKIWLTAAKAADSAQMSLRDNGVGIPGNMLPEIFDMFTQIDRDRKQAQGGLGIGLALAKKLIEMHGGAIEARSNGPGEGSEFLIRLPLAHKNAQSLRIDSARDQTRTLPSVHRVLVVDDNADAATSLGLLLETLGNDVQVAQDGPSALRLLDAYRPQIVFLDLGMPGMSGYEVAKKMRENPAFDNITLVALTGWGQEDDRRRTQQAGFDYHLVKPMGIAPVKEVLSNMDVKGSRLASELA